MGLPRMWGRVGDQIVREVTRGKEDVGKGQLLSEERGLDYRWTLAYYIVLVAGVVAFYKTLWFLTYSDEALAIIS